MHYNFQTTGMIFQTHSSTDTYCKKQGQTHMEKGCKDLRIFIIQGNIIKKFDMEYGFADVKLSK